MSSAKISRIIDMGQTAELMAMALMLYSLPRPQEVDAIAVFPGLGEGWRLTAAVTDWNTSSADHLLVAGINNTERTFRQPTIETLRKSPIGLQRSNNVHIAQTAANTPAQAEWLAQKVKELDISSLALYVSPYHLLRAYCTTLSTFKKSGLLGVALIPMPVPIAPNRAIPETKVPAWEMIAGEVQRIADYQKKGDVCSYAELRTYLDWLWKQPPLVNHEAL